MNSKPRSDAVLLKLSDDHKEKLRENLLAGMSHLDMEQMKADVFAKLDFDSPIPPKTDQGNPNLTIPGDRR